MGNSTDPKTLHSLQEVADKLEQDYYDLLEILCTHVDEHTRKMLGSDLFAEYVEHANCLVGQVRGFVTERRDVYIPYVFQLAEKKAAGHNCNTCSGHCDMRHRLTLEEFYVSQKKIYDTANRVLTQLAEQIRNLKDPGQVVALRNDATLIRNKISQLVDYEELFLLPRIKDAQKDINAHS